MANDDLKALIGGRIAALRKELGFTQKSLGEAAGLEREIVNQIENGTTLLRSAPRRSALAKAFRLTSDEIALVIDGDLSTEAAAAIARSRGAVG